MWYQIFAYFKFFFKSTNQHGIHSPFVYDLVTQCFYDKKRFHEYPFIDQYRKELLNNHTLIEVKDFGAGSRVFSSNKRKVSAIAKNAGIWSKKFHEFDLFDIMRFVFVLDFFNFLAYRVQ